jgi:hypothetical protein
LEHAPPIGVMHLEVITDLIDEFAVLLGLGQRVEQLVGDAVAQGEIRTGRTVDLRRVRGRGGPMGSCRPRRSRSTST